MRRPYRTAAVARVELTRPLAAIRPAPHHDEVLLVAAVAGRMVGQVFVEAHPVIEPEEQWRAIAAELEQEVVAALVAARLALVAGLAPDPAGEREPAAAVVVCTRRRPESLDACLASIARLRTRPAEVVVVDNTEGDGATADVCRRHGALRVVEPVPGQSRARNRGLLATDSEIVAFTDDDCAVDTRWLDRLGAAFADPMVMCVTGYIGPLELETPAQYLFERHGGFERRPRRTVFDVTRRPPILGAAIAGAGANMMYRREVFSEVGNFAEDLGPGTPARSSDDKYQFYRVLMAGYRIAYEPDRIVWHRHRRELPELRRVLNDYGVAEFAYTTRCLVRHRDPSALHVQRWWLDHAAGEIRRALGRGGTEVPTALALEELRGALAGPRALRRAIASRADIEPLPPPAGGAGASSGTPARVVGEAPLLTATVATHNRREPLRGVLQALAGQELPADRFEVVVVVDGSTDGSAEMARAFAPPYALRVLEQPNRGLAASRNRGAREAAHPVVVFLDDDIRPGPGGLAAHAAAHAAGEPHCALGYYPPAITSASLWPATLRLWWEEHFRRKARPGHRWSFFDVVDGNSSIRVDQLDAVGRFDERFTGGRRQDYELGIRLLEAGVPLRFHGAARAAHHLDTRIEKAFANASAEGRYDVLLATIHPKVAGRLLLATLAERVRQAAGGPRRALAPLPESATLALLRMLEAGRQRRRWRRLLYEQLLRAYAAGATEACGGAEPLAEFLEHAIGDRPARVETVRLDAEAPAPSFDASVPVALQLCYGGRSLGRIEATVPNQQWDWDTVMARVEKGVRWPGTVASAAEALAAGDRRGG